MGFKDLFIVSDEPSEKKTPIGTTRLSFPTPGSNTASPTPQPATINSDVVVVGNTNCKPYMESVMSLYEKGFNSLNQPGIEFFEFFKAVSSSGIDNPSAYGMAFNMLSSMDPSLSKEKLLEASKLYVTEIQKVHTNYQNEGNTRMSQMQNEKSTETESLRTEISLLEQQVQGIQNQIAEKQLALSGMDKNYNPKMEEIKCKLEANNYAKDIMQTNLQKVISGIKSNL